MTRRRLAGRTPPTGDGTDPTAVLDWRDRAHWGGRLAPCRYCHRPAFCRDDDGRPATRRAPSWP